MVSSACHLRTCDVACKHHEASTKSPYLGSPDQRATPSSLPHNYARLHLAVCSISLDADQLHPHDLRHEVRHRGATGAYQKHMITVRHKRLTTLKRLTRLCWIRDLSLSSARAWISRKTSFVFSGVGHLDLTGKFKRRGAEHEEAGEAG